MKETFGLDSNVFVRLYDENGVLKDQREIHNLVTTNGKIAIMDQLLSVPSINKKMGWMELGTGSGCTAASTTLSSYTGSRVAMAKTQGAGTSVITCVTTFGAGVSTNSAITEAGTFDSNTSNAGNMWMYASFVAINKGASDTLTITWTLTAS